MLPSDCPTAWGFEGTTSFSFFLYYSPLSWKSVELGQDDLSSVWSIWKQVPGCGQVEGALSRRRLGMASREAAPWLRKTLLPLHLMLKQSLLMALESLFLARKPVAVLCSPTPREAELGSARLAARGRREEKRAQQRDRSRVIFNAGLQACLKIEGEPFPSN